MKSFINFVIFFVFNFTFFGCTDEISMNPTIDVTSMPRGDAQGTADISGDSPGIPPECEDDDDCDDTLFCNGTETCNHGVCMPKGIPPCGVNRIDSEFCNEDFDQCGSCVDKGWAWCDDGTEATTETCSAENRRADGQIICQYSVTPGWCLIAFGGWKTGDKNPNDPCLVCDTDQSKESWTQVPNCPAQPDPNPEADAFETADGATDDGFVPSPDAPDADSEISSPDTDVNGSTDEDVPDSGNVDAEIEVTEPPKCLDGQCGDGNACTLDLCDPTTGCTHTPELPSFCDDAKFCTDDYCDPATGCVFTPNTNPCDDGIDCTEDDVCNPGKLGCYGVANNAKCDDGNACTIDVCKSWWGCVPSGPPACDDENVCTKDSCEPATGCTHTNNNFFCNDGDACTLGDVCQAGNCQPGTTLKSCNDLNPCTDDSCDPTTGCVHTPNAETCTDNNPCTMGDVCQAGICQAGTPLNCDDGNECKLEEKCFGGACTWKSKDCDDGNYCTTDSCDPATGCIHANNTFFCNDGDACTFSGQCTGGQCIGLGPIGCDDKNPCTDDSCDPATGCIHAPNTAPCTDGNVCTDGDTCQAGNCQPGAPMKCTDGNVCTADFCDPGSSGCVSIVWVKNPPNDDCSYGNIDADGYQDLGGDVDADADGFCDNQKDLADEESGASWTENQTCTGLDNCWWVSNPSQQDSDEDGVGNACDPTP